MEAACVGPEDGRGGISRNFLVERCVLSRLTAFASWHWERGGLIRGTMASTYPSVWEQAAPPVLSLKPNSSDPPSMSLVQPWAPAPALERSGWASLSVRCGPFKRKVSASPQSTQSHSAETFVGFHSQGFWGLLGPRSPQNMSTWYLRRKVGEKKIEKYIWSNASQKLPKFYENYKSTKAESLVNAQNNNIFI